jgi:hypothetical protein
MTIPLASPLLARSSNLPESVGWAIRVRPSHARRPAALLFGLAPCGVLPATRVATGAVRSYRTFSPLLPSSRLIVQVPDVTRALGKEWRDGLRCSRHSAVNRPDGSGIFSVPLSFELPRPGITRRTALRSSDFPPSDSALSRFVRRWSSCSLRSPYCTASRRIPVRSGTAPASCTGCCGGCRSLRRSSRYSSRSRAAWRRETRARRCP